MRRSFRAGLVLALLAAAIPAAAQQGKATDVLAKLQREAAANPSSVAANRALGIWYYHNQRFSEARAATSDSSASMRQRALRRGLIRSARFSTAFIVSTGESLPRR